MRLAVVDSLLVLTMAVFFLNVGAAYARPIERVGEHFRSGAHPAYARVPQKRVDHSKQGRVVRQADPKGAGLVPRGADRVDRQYDIDPDYQRRTGHMSPEDRRLLREHIEDAVHDLYSR
ncbi:hypothetical protein [Pandoraea thiooxydans]|uniref:hypothetical protein n=1 Tax=Pandoraea thiooxydans TaxID=445709 RepID=UPI000A5F45C7|nr:hypothetical protein [Pandoraea thiooxydans]